MSDLNSSLLLGTDCIGLPFVLSGTAALGSSLPFSAIDPNNDSPSLPYLATSSGVLTNLA